METYKLKIRIGQHEFEAEGPQDAIERQFEIFKELITSTPTPTKSPPPSPPDNSQSHANEQGAAKNFNSIFRHEGRVVSLTAPPQDRGEGAMLILLGQKLYQSEETPTGSQLADGLRRSGYVVDRVDRTVDEFVEQGLIIKMGTKKGTRYRLTNTGVPRAEAIAERIKNMVS